MGGWFNNQATKVHRAFVVVIVDVLWGGVFRETVSVKKRAETKTGEYQKNRDFAASFLAMLFDGINHETNQTKPPRRQATVCHQVLAYAPEKRQRLWQSPQPKKGIKAGKRSCFERGFCFCWGGVAEAGAGGDGLVMVSACAG